MTEHTHAHHIMRATAIHNRIRNQRDALIKAIQEIADARLNEKGHAIVNAMELLDRIKAEESAT